MRPVKYGVQYGCIASGRVARSNVEATSARGDVMTDEKIEINPSYYDPAGRIANPERVIEVGRPIRFATFKIRTAIYFGFWAAFGAFSVQPVARPHPGIAAPGGLHRRATMESRAMRNR